MPETPTERHSRKAIWALTAVALVGVAGLLVEICGNRLPLVRDMAAVLGSTPTVYWLVLACLAHLVAVGFGVLRWWVLLSAVGLPIPLFRLFQSWLMARFVGTTLFGVAGRDACRLLDSAHYTKRAAEPAAALVVERVCGLLALFLFMLISLPIVRRFVTVDPQWLLVIAGLSALASGVGLLLVLHPTLAPLLAAIVPAPASWRAPLDRFATAVSGFGVRKKSLAMAVLASLARHLATWLTLAALVMAIRGATTAMPNALSAGPALLFGPRLGPFLGAGGTARMVLQRLADAGIQGTDPNALFDVAAWLSVTLVPALLGCAALLILILRWRYVGRTFMRRSSEPGVSQPSAHEHAPYSLTPTQTAAYRTAMADALSGGPLGGLVAGAVVGLAEGLWLAHGMVNPPELQLLWWGPLAYGLLLSGCGLAIACAASLALARIGRDPLRMGGAFALATGGTVTASLLIIGRWRYVRDVLHGREVTLGESTAVFGVAVLLGVVLAALLALVAAKAPGTRRAGSLAALLVYASVIVAGGFLAAQPSHEDGEPVAPGSASPDAPNIVLVVIDTLRADYLGLYGGSTATPNLEAVASDGLLFRNHFAQAPWTKPSFATLFTSRYPSEHGAVAKPTPLPPDLPTLAEALGANGYYTKGFANNRNIIPSEGFDRGFTEYDFLEPNLLLGARSSSSELALYEVLRRIYTRLLSRTINPENFYEPGEGVNRAVFDWLDRPDRPDNPPWFLFVHYMDPHDPYMVADDPGVGYAMIELGFHPDAAHYREPMHAAYLDEIQHVDRCLGALLDGLRARDLYDDAAILITADHGEELYDHGGWWHGETLYEEQLHVPLIVKLPQNRLAGTVRDDFARHLDVAPTLLTLAGAATPDAMRGQSLFDDPNATPPSLSFAERHFGGYTLRSVRSETAKLITSRPRGSRPRGSRPGGSPEFYDLLADPTEQRPQPAPPDAATPSLAAEMARFEASVGH